MESLQASLAERPDSAGWDEPVRPAPAPRPPAPVSGEVSRYGAGRRVNWVSLGMIVALHAAGLVAMIRLSPADPASPKPPPLVVNMVELSPVPPESAPPPEPVDAPPEPARVPPAMAPPPIVRVAVSAPPVVTAPEPPPPAPVAAAAPAAKAAPSAGPPAPPGPVSAGDLSASPVYAPPPRYPRESRIRRETGTVMLSVLLGTNGAVEEISVHRTSGHDRLDEAALRAVKRWKWSPMVRGGEPVKVRGLVRIPFELVG